MTQKYSGAILLVVMRHLHVRSCKTGQCGVCMCVFTFSCKRCDMQKILKYSASAFRELIPTQKKGFFSAQLWF